MAAADDGVDVSKIKLPGLGGEDGGAEETVKQVALDDDDDVPVQVRRRIGEVAAPFG